MKKLVTMSAAALTLMMAAPVSAQAESDGGCQNAHLNNLSVGQIISSHLSSGGGSDDPVFWYSVTLTAGTSYIMEWTLGSGSAFLYKECGEDTLARKDEPYAVTASGTYLLQMSTDNATFRFWIKEVPAVLSVSVTPPAASAAKGDTLEFQAQVSVQGSASQAVTWDVEGGGAGTGISDSGLLTIGADETASTLWVTATSTFDDTKVGTAQVTILRNSAPAVLSVRITPAAASVARGSTWQFQAQVSVQDGADTGVTWSVSGSHNAGTSISGGSLIVASNETARTLWVAATSVFDSTKADTAVVTLYGGASTAAEAHSLPKLAVYPNPVGDVLYITDAFVGDVEIYTLTGTLVLLTDRASINIARLPAGTYIVKAGGRVAKVVKR